jgi:hypothetical protein
MHVAKNKEMIDDMIRLEKELVYGCKKVFKRKDFNNLVKEIGIISSSLDKYFCLSIKGRDKAKKKML